MNSNQMSHGLSNMKFPNGNEIVLTILILVILLILNYFK